MTSSKNENVSHDARETREKIHREEFEIFDEVISMVVVEICG